MDMMTTTAARQWPNQIGSAVQAEDRAAALRARRDCRLAALLPEGAQAWLMDERFDADREIWIVDLLRADIRYGWRLQRYQYDAATDNLYFWGERPVPVMEVRALPLHTLPRFHPVVSAARADRRIDSDPKPPARNGEQRAAPSDQAIDEALEETFPASDPPFWMPSGIDDK